MPMYYFACEKCGDRLTTICSPANSKDERICRCGGKYLRTPRGVSTTSMETLDNGIMPRAVTRYTDAEEVYKNLDNRGKGEHS